MTTNPVPLIIDVHAHPGRCYLAGLDTSDPLASALGGEDVEAALAAADVESLWNAIAQLEQLGPLRVSTRLGDIPEEPAPADVRERINELIDTLVREDGPIPGDRGDSGQDSGHDYGMSAG